MIEIVGAPFDYCGYRYGASLGPAALRLAGLATTLESIGIVVADAGDAEFGPESTVQGGIKNFDPAISTYAWLRDQVARINLNGDVALCLGGDHSCSIGSISGALQAFGDDLAVLWVDAHTDLNTPDTSPSGNLHGMVLGALLGEKCDPTQIDHLRYDPKLVEHQWDRLLTEIVGPKPLSPKRVGWLAVRDVDQGERERLRKLSGEYMATMYDIDRYGLVEMLSQCDKRLRDAGIKKLWISFDVDSLDPFLAPGTGTAVRGGLTYREMHLMGEMIHELLSDPTCPYSLAGIDLVETNPLFDTNNETARTAVEWIASVFGKTILGKR